MTRVSAAGAASFCSRTLTSRPHTGAAPASGVGAATPRTIAASGSWRHILPVPALTAGVSTCRSTSSPGRRTARASARKAPISRRGGLHVRRPSSLNPTGSVRTAAPCWTGSLAGTRCSARSAATKALIGSSARCGLGLAGVGRVTSVPRSLSAMAGRAVSAPNPSTPHSRTPIRSAGRLTTSSPSLTAGRMTSGICASPTSYATCAAARPCITDRDGV